MEFKRIIFIILLVIVVASSFIFFKRSNSSQRDDAVFIVGTASGYAPFVSVNAQGDYEGFDIDVAQALAQKMGKKLIIKDLGSMSSLFIALNQGSIDAIMWGLSITQERLKKVIMVQYQGEAITAYPLLFWKQIPSGVTCVEDMKNMTICVEPASVQDAVLRKYDGIINTKSVEKIDDALLDIQYGKAQAALVEPAIAKKFKNKYPEIQMLNVPLTSEEQEQGMGIAMNLANTKLAGLVQACISQLQNEGVIKKLENKWSIV